MRVPACVAQVSLLRRSQWDFTVTWQPPFLDDGVTVDESVTKYSIEVATTVSVYILPEVVQLCGPIEE